MKWKLKITGERYRARCFTYDGLFRHADIVKAKIRRLTLDRNIRKLREKGFLYSYKPSKRSSHVIYCVEKDLAESLFNYLEASLNSS